MIFLPWSLLPWSPCLTIFFVLSFSWLVICPLGLGSIALKACSSSIVIDMALYLQGKVRQVSTMDLSLILWKLNGREERVS
ncbi:hypothetical protein BT96DRAFT_121782 [Gymnopus androsaceus JB14]|uniref:Uncharacterized protein n=1 Tax=Gymnopus androsaceus JB14 TaxID=1447944 RepID=A0A6A4GC91_9AGAR|nr:hypothetical protein BT96DRAFT_121782 [Gymnopus androsaceus JB14]